jgi:hypothetical protein
MKRSGAAELDKRYAAMPIVLVGTGLCPGRALRPQARRKDARPGARRAATPEGRVLLVSTFRLTSGPVDLGRL